MSAAPPLYILLVLSAALLTPELTRSTAICADTHLLNLASTAWSSCGLYAGLASAASIRGFWNAAVHGGIACGGPLWLLLALHNAGSSADGSRRARMLLGALPLLGILIGYLTGFSFEIASLDALPIALAIAGLIFAYVVSRGHLQGLGPIARQIVLEGLDDGMIVVNRHGRVVEHNPAATALAALARPAAKRPIATATAHPDLGAALAEMFAAGPAQRSEREITIPAPRPAILHVTLTPLADARGRRIGALYMLRDITQRVKTEQLLARRVADLTLLHTIASAVGSTLEPHDLLRAIVVTTRDTLGMTHATVSLLDEARWRLVIIAESDAEASALGAAIPLQDDAVAEASRTGTPVVIEDAQHDERLAVIRDLLVRRQTRSVLIVPLRAGDRLMGTLNLASAAPRQFDAAELALAQLIAGYVTTALLNAQLFDASQQAVRMKSAILDTISHEFRTPITAILGFTELYQEHILGPVTPEQQEALEAVHRGAHRLLKLVDDLLDLARLEAGKLDLSLQAVDVQLCIREAITLVAPQFDQKRIDLRTHVAADLPLAWADTMWLRRVLVNLLMNALRFTSAGVVTVRAYEARARAHPHKQDSAAPGSHVLAIEVEDTGPGIAETEQQTVFEAFRRAESAQASVPSSAGLGLTISRRVVEQMDGQITLHSQPGQGSIFTITLRTGELQREHPRY